MENAKDSVNGNKKWVESKMDDAGTKHYVPVTSDKFISNSYRRETLGNFLESRDTQIVVILLILLDVSSAVLVKFFELQEVDYGIVLSTFNHLLQSFTGFTLVLFLLELGTLVVLFGTKFFGHLGYCLDLVVLGAILYWELQTQSKCKYASQSPI